MNSLASDANFDSLDGGAGHFQQTRPQCGFQELQLRRPGWVVDFHYQRGAVQLHRLHMQSNGSTNGFLPPTEHAAHHGCWRCRGTSLGAQRTNYLMQTVAQTDRFIPCHRITLPLVQDYPTTTRRLSDDNSAGFDSDNRIRVGCFRQRAGGREHHLAGWKVQQ